MVFLLCSGRDSQYSIVFRLVRFSSFAFLVTAAAAILAVAHARADGPLPQEAEDEETVRVLVAYYSLRGNTEQLARAAAEGAGRVPNVTVTLKKVDEVTRQDLVAADGIVLGSPTYYANIAGAMKAAIDDWSWKMKVDFTDKVGGAFATGGGQTGGKEHTAVSLLLFMLSNRMVVAGPLYQDEEGEDIWGEPGSSAMTGPLDPGVGAGELDAARRLGQRVAEVASKLKAARGPRTVLSIQDGKWRLNGRVTYPGASAEGMLMNVRMVNSIFEDRRRTDFDAEANTSEFLASIPDYAACGVLAFTLCLQGGSPDYEGAVNSAFNPDGSLRAEYLKRAKRVIRACDQQGLAVILGCYYQRQDQILRDEAAVRNGVVEVAQWIGREGFGNVALEIANEFPHEGFDHAILKSPTAEAELIRLAKKTRPGLLVSTSGIGDGEFPEEAAQDADFLLIHYNGVPVEEIPAKIAALKKYKKPIVSNEDDKAGQEAARAAELSVANGASWGFMLKEVNQSFPFRFQGEADDPTVYAKFRDLTEAK